MFESSQNDSFDKSLLALAFILGIGGSIGLKYFDAPIFVPAIWSGLTIFLYAVVTYKSRSARLEPDQIGDNAYYLGFVLTLTSLSYTLYGLGGDGGDAAGISDVIAGFGVALSSTIVGVATRVFLLQFRLDLVARDREAQLVLNEAMRAFRSELADSIRGMKYMGAEIRQSLNEHHVALADSQEALLGRTMERMVTAFEGSLGGLVDRSRIVNAELAKNSEQTVATSSECLVNTISQLEKALAAGALRIEAAANNIAMDAASRIVAQNQAANAQLESIRVTQDRAADEVRKSNEDLYLQVSDAIKGAAMTIRRDQGDLNDALQQSANQMANVVSEFDKSLGALAAATKTTAETIILEGREMNERLQKAATSARDF